MSEDARPARALPPPIYLHFLDRELGDAFEFRLDLRTAQRALSALVLGTASPLVCSISALLENEGLKGGETMVGDLVAADVVSPQSTHYTLDDFLASRREMYEHDQERYPLYFGVEPLGALGGLEPRPVSGSTTRTLHSRLEAWTEGDPAIRSTTQRLPADAHARMTTVVAAELARRENRAITYAMFRGVVGDDPSGAVVERAMRQRISLEYTDHQRGRHGQLATGIGLPLEALERALQPQWPFERDIGILRALLRSAGLATLIDSWEAGLWRLILPLRGSAGHIDLVSRIQWIARALDEAIPGYEGRAIRRQQAISAIRGASSSEEAITAADPEGFLAEAQARLDHVIEALRDGGLGSSLERFAEVLTPLRADVLLIVATDVEQACTFREFGFPPGTSPRTHPLGQQIYFELDRGKRVFLVRSEMGSEDTGGSQFTTDDAIRDLRPKCVLMVGIAFGVNSQKQSIGDVLVPTAVIPYNHKRVGTDEEGARTVDYRDPPYRADPMLLKRLRAGAVNFAEATVRFGRLLSGSELIDNKDHRTALVEGAAKGNAIGGEMELYGVFAAASRQQARCAGAKAICDFGENKSKDKASRQQLAATNAARFARHAIERGALRSPP